MKKVKVVAVLACPSGVAHTYLASAALKKYAAQYDVDVVIETQGALGIDHELTDLEIKEANYIIVSNDINIQGMSRFSGKKVIFLKINDIVTKTEKIISKIVNME